MTADSPTPDELADSMLRATPEDPTVDARPPMPDLPDGWHRTQHDLDTKRHDLTLGSLLASFGAGLVVGVLVGMWLA